MRQCEQQVAHQRTRRLFHQGRDLGSDAFQSLDGREQGKENLRPHGQSIARLAPARADLYIGGSFPSIPGDLAWTIRV